MSQELRPFLALSPTLLSTSAGPQTLRRVIAPDAFSHAGDSFGHTGDEPQDYFLQAELLPFLDVPVVFKIAN